MDDEKSITEKLTDAISNAAGSVKSVASTLVDKASNAAQHAMEANAKKISRIPPAKTGPAQVGTTNAQVTIPETSDAAAMPMPLLPVAPAPKKLAPKKLAPKKVAAVRAEPGLSGRITPTDDGPPKSKTPTAGEMKKGTAKKAVGKNSSRKPARKTAKPALSRKSRSFAGDKSAGKDKTKTLSKTVEKATKSKRGSRRS